MAVIAQFPYRYEIAGQLVGVKHVLEVEVVYAHFSSMRRCDGPIGGGYGYRDRRCMVESIESVLVSEHVTA